MEATDWKPPHTIGAVGDSIRVLTLNLGHGRGRSSHQALLTQPRIESNLNTVASVLRQSGAEVVALQEADGPCWWSGKFDHVDFLARRGEYPYVFRGAHRKLAQIDCGTAILSRLPLEDTFSSSLWSGALRPAKGYVLATIRCGPMEIDVASIHIDFMSRSMRRKQLGHVATELHNRGRPVILLGDLNCSWLREPTLLELATRLDLVPFAPDSELLPTFPQPRPRRRIDWILVSRGMEFRHYEVLRKPISDHAGVLAEVKVY
jgi:endonuclease/exonuclease/phosphatase family metal-dependent hydrolase